jgi:adenylyltransferase/sulfurtransferase
MALSDDAKKIEEAGAVARYSRQVLLAQLGEHGQQKFSTARVVLIGCGALGTVLADTLVRAGVGFLRIIDRDFVELGNLQRQVLFDEQDAHSGTPKAVAAAQRLAKINSLVEVEPVVADIHAGNVESFITGASVILDGTDNFETRFLINDAAVKHNIPWVYGACVAADGMVMTIVPHQTPCLRCVWERPPPPGISPTCDTVGVFASVVHIVASLQAMEAIKLITGQAGAITPGLLQIDAWRGQFSRFDMQGAHERGDCPCCGKGNYEYLDSGLREPAASLCGRDAVQVHPQTGLTLDFEALAAKIAPVAKSPPTHNRYLLRFEVDRVQVTVFRDGRAIIKGTCEPEEARSIYARYIGA